jgi:DNA-binding protein H-NS
MAEYQIQIGNDVRDMTDDEIVQRKKDEAEAAAQIAARAERAETRAALLARLGITDDEAALLLG